LKRREKIRPRQLNYILENNVPTKDEQSPRVFSGNLRAGLGRPRSRTEGYVQIMLTLTRYVHKKWMDACIPFGMM
jgi:hypothetical protein